MGCVIKIGDEVILTQEGRGVFGPYETDVHYVIKINIDDTFKYKILKELRGMLL